MNIGICDTNGGGTEILISVKFISTQYHADTLHFGFVVLHGAEKISISHLATDWYLMCLDEKNVWLPVMVVSGVRCFETPWTQQLSLLVREVRQMVASAPARRESIVLDLPVTGLYIFPVVVGSWCAKLMQWKGL